MQWAYNNAEHITNIYGSYYYYHYHVVVVVQLPSCVHLFVTPWTAACQASLSLTIPRSLPRFIFIALVIPSPPLMPSSPLPSIFPSIRDFLNELSVHIRWTKYWRFSFSIGPSREYSGLISLKISWFDLFTVQGTFKSSSAPQFEGINSLVFCLLYGPALMTTGKTIALTIWTFVGRVMSLLFNTLSRFVIVLLPRSNHLLISWL